MDLIFLLAGMVVAGLIVGAVAGLIWKENRPIGVTGDYLVSILVTVMIGLIDWYVIPAMGFSDTMKYLGVLFEPALGSLLVLWLIRKAKK